LLVYRSRHILSQLFASEIPLPRPTLTWLSRGPQVILDRLLSSGLRLDDSRLAYSRGRPYGFLVGRCSIVTCTTAGSACIGTSAIDSKPPACPTQLQLTNQNCWPVLSAWREVQVLLLSSGERIWTPQWSVGNRSNAWVEKKRLESSWATTRLTAGPRESGSNQG
jgi:hypothetical protein